MNVGTFSYLPNKEEKKSIPTGFGPDPQVEQLSRTSSSADCLTLGLIFII